MFLGSSPTCVATYIATCMLWHWPPWRLGTQRRVLGGRWCHWPSALLAPAQGGRCCQPAAVYGHSESPVWERESGRGGKKRLAWETLKARCYHLGRCSSNVYCWPYWIDAGSISQSLVLAEMCLHTTVWLSITPRPVFWQGDVV